MVTDGTLCGERIHRQSVDIKRWNRKEIEWIDRGWAFKKASINTRLNDIWTNYCLNAHKLTHKVMM